MRVKLDENLPASALAVAQDLGHDVDTVVIEGLAGEDDDVVLAAAAADGRFLITFDRGLADVRAHPPGSHPGIAVLRLESENAQAAVDAVRQLLALDHLDDLVGCIVVVRGNLLRVRRPE